jgi:ornithine--oxo-acid transaminase
MWAIEFGEPESGRATWRLLERMQPGIFAQLVVVPLFTEHRILSQVAGHKVNVVKGLPPLTITEADVDWFATALGAVVGEAQKMGRAMTSFAIRAARAGRGRKKAGATAR